MYMKFIMNIISLTGCTNQKELCSFYISLDWLLWETHFKEQNTNDISYTDGS